MCVCVCVCVCVGGPGGGLTDKLDEEGVGGREAVLQRRLLGEDVDEGPLLVRQPAILSSRTRCRRGTAPRPTACRRPLLLAAARPASVPPGKPTRGRGGGGEGVAAQLWRQHRPRGKFVLWPACPLRSAFWGRLKGARGGARAHRRRAQAGDSARP